MDAKEMLDAVDGWTFQHEVRFIGGLVVRRLICDQEPRVSVVSRFNEVSTTARQIWQVDGIDYLSFDLAIAKLILDHSKIIKGIE